ncbi:phage tail protein [Pseudomonas lundensis]|uniref:phage tail protein n=1 Tax=Pseudomonas lundensis TaxID=86185 RepID=UPI0039080E9F
MTAVARKRMPVAGSKGGESKPKQPSIAANGVPSLATVRMVYLWSWGPIVGPVNGSKSIKLDGTPLVSEDGTENFPGVKWQFRNGELNQERLEGLTESNNEISVNRELLSTAPYLHSISNTVVDAVRVRFGWPQLQSQDASGNINTVRIDYSVEVSTDGGPYATALSAFVDRKNVTKYERSHRIELPAGNRWTVRVRRLTPEAGSSTVQDGMLLESITQIVDSDQEYPLTAVSSIEYDAQQFGGSIAKIAVLMRGRIVRVPANYDPQTRTYATGGTGTSNGVWDGTFKEAYTNNPAWVFYDLVLNPYYGLGERIDATMVDRWALYRISQYCDQMVPDGRGGTEPRFTCNLYLQKQAEAYAVLQDLASIFHGLAFWDGNQITVNADMPSDPVFNYSPSMILNDGAINYSGTRWRDRHNLSMVSWDNPDQGFATEKEPVFDEDAMADTGTVREMSLEAFGCTSQGQAQRAGSWALLTEQQQMRGATFRVGLDGQIPKPGQVISLSDPMLAGRANGGRISAVAGRVITLDRDIDVPPGARLHCNLPSGKAEGRVIKSVKGRQITLMADYSEQPEPELGWALDYDDLKLMQFYVRNVTRPEWHQFQLEVIQHEPSKFDAIDYGTVLDDRPISGLPAGTQDAPARVLLSQHVVIEQGLATTIMTIAWDSAPGAVAYDVEWRWGAREWVKIPRTGELAVDVRGIYAGQYMARVRAVNAMQVASLPTSSMMTDLQGKAGKPPAVTHLTTESLVYGIRLNWGFPLGAENTQRTEIWQNKANDLQSAIKLGDYAYPQARHELQNIVPGTSLFFWARLVDRTGNVGPWFPEKFGVNGQPSSDQTEYEKYFAGKIGTGALYPELKKDIELITGDGPGSVKELAEQVKELGDKVEGLVDTFIYDPKLTYKTGENAREGRHIYQALQDVPRDTPPPNPAYWKDIGEILETANGLAFQVNQNTTSIKDLDGKVTASASSLEALRAAARGDTGEGELADALKSWQSTAELAVEKRVRATEDEAISERVTTFGAQVGENKAGLSSLEKVVATNDSVAAKRITELKGELSDVGSGVAGNTQALETLSGEVSRIDGTVVATASSLESLRADARSDTGEGDLAGALDAWSSTANFAQEKKVRATAEEALAMKTEQLQVNLNQTTASVEQVSKAVVDVNGRVSAQTTIKAQTIVGGRKVMAGLALGSDGDTSEILAFAQRFAIIDEVTGQLRTPFVVQGGQVFINYAMIDTAFIQNLVLGMTLRSSALNAKGLPLLEINIPQGMLTLRSPGAGGSTTLNNNGLLVQDEDDSVRLRAGNLTLLKAGG